MVAGRDEFLGRVPTVTLAPGMQQIPHGHVDVVITRYDDVAIPVVRLTRSSSSLSFTRAGAEQLAGLLHMAWQRLYTEAMEQAIAEGRTEGDAAAGEG
jgi:hypothetical protein